MNFAPKIQDRFYRLSPCLAMGASAIWLGIPVGSLVSLFCLGLPCVSLLKKSRKHHPTSKFSLASQVIEAGVSGVILLAAINGPQVQFLRALAKADYLAATSITSGNQMAAPTEFYSYWSLTQWTPIRESVTVTMEGKDIDGPCVRGYRSITSNVVGKQGQLQTIKYPTTSLNYCVGEGKRPIGYQDAVTFKRDDTTASYLISRPLVGWGLVFPPWFPVIPQRVYRAMNGLHEFFVHPNGPS